MRPALYIVMASWICIVLLRYKTQSPGRGWSLSCWEYRFICSGRGGLQPGFSHNET